MAKIKLTGKVLKQDMLMDGIYSMWIQADEIARQSVPGQFISVYTRDGGKLLPRPISLCEIDREAGTLRIVYRVAGAGTKEFSAYQAGDPVEIMGPLGNGFPLKEKKAFLIGGGIENTETYLWRQKTEAAGQREMYWMPSGNII